jgi:hypothetical protein
MPETTTVELVATISLGILSTGATVIMWRRDVKERETKYLSESKQRQQDADEKEAKNRRENEQKQAQIIQQLRHKLDNNADLLEVVKILKDEKALRKERPVLDSECPKNAGRMRDLPGFLEGFGSLYEYKIISIEAAYNAVGREVILCDDSTWMWLGEAIKKDDTFWRVFNLFAKAIRTEAAKRPPL